MDYGRKDMKWVRVSRAARCPICNGPDYCTRSADGKLIHCMRVESRRPSRSKLGGWIHILDQPLPEIKIREKKQAERPNINWSSEAKRMYVAKQARETRMSLAESLGVSPGALESLIVGWGWDSYRSCEFSSWPEWDASAKCVGIVRRYADGSKKTIRYSSHGVYYANDLLAMPGPCFIVEGGSDTAACLTIGVNAIGRPSNLGGVEYCAALLRNFKKAVVVIAENDENPGRRGDPKVPSCPVDCRGCLHCYPGLFGAYTFASNLKGIIRRPVWVRLLPGAKDTREWLNKNPFASPIEFFEAVNQGPVYGKLTAQPESAKCNTSGANLRGNRKPGATPCPQQQFPRAS